MIRGEKKGTELYTTMLAIVFISDKKQSKCLKAREKLNKLRSIYTMQLSKCFQVIFHVVGKDINIVKIYIARY